jgi:hypothetical protein
MRKITKIVLVLLIAILSIPVHAQEYFLKKYAPFDPDIPSPEEFLGYPVGSHHTRYDRIVAYFNKLAEVSDKALITQYGQTFEYRPLIILTISDPGNISNLDEIRDRHLKNIDPSIEESVSQDKPVFINLGYGVHGNEPSSAEAAMLTAYTLLASQNAQIGNYLENAVIFIDPTINPDGRDRHTWWANMYKANPLVGDPMDAEHNEVWPRGRTNHYWFDLNRDWYLAINPESRGKLTWYHQWYPNVVTDFHEMGSSSTYFFEPMKDNGSLNPIMPEANYTTLNDTFARYYQEGLDSIGSLYFTKEVFDGTYPGYGSSYPDLQGGLALLFEQASSRGHLQKLDNGSILFFPFTIRNQYVSSMATVTASVENKSLLNNYQRDFFKSALANASKSQLKAYVFGDQYDRNRTLAFIDKLLLHKIEVYSLSEETTISGKKFSPEMSFIIPTEQAQYRMVQSVFETYSDFRDSVFYDASAWSLANFYNMPYGAISDNIKKGEIITDISNLINITQVEQSDYAYIIPWDDYNAPAFLYFLQEHGILASSAFKSFAIPTNLDKERKFEPGAILVPVKRQSISEDSVYNLIRSGSEKYYLEIHSVETGYSSSGIDLGSGNISKLKKPSVLMIIGDGISSYEAGEVWHLLDTRMHMPVTKVQIRHFDRIEFHKYNVMVMVSGSYHQLDSIKQEKIKSWVSDGNTLITIRNANSWIIKQKLVKEELIKEEKDTTIERLPYISARENIGKERIGGAIFEVELDLTHPLSFGYHSKQIPVYRNSTVWIKPSKNPYSTVARYTEEPLIDGFITDKNLNEYLKKSASLIVSKIGSGRVVMFADNPNFRGSWYGTNRLFLNGIFLGQKIRVPE